MTAAGASPSDEFSEGDMIVLNVAKAASGKAFGFTVALDIVPDDDDPYALLRATGEGGDALAEVKVSAGFKLSRASATAWADGGFGRP
jgi:hypothetical protein